MSLVEVQNLSMAFPISQGPLRPPVMLEAVRDVSFSIEKGKTLGLVGESGCGKSTLGRCLLRLLQPTAGRISYSDQDITHLSPHQLRPFRLKMQIIFQDPYSSLNPRMTVGQILEEPLRIYQSTLDAKERQTSVSRLIDKVGLPANSVSRYPHEFSGGQRQRIGIARALTVNPDFIVCDEPVSALDVSIQAQILNLLMDLQDELGLTYLFISHDLRVVERISHHVAVMYLGKIVEEGPCEDLFKDPKHPYTQALMSAIPQVQFENRIQRVILEGEPPPPLNPPTGCAFHPRCPISEEICEQNDPELLPIGHSQRCASCHIAQR